MSRVTESEENRTKRIEETRHVMKELKSVLHVKTSAEEREIRKSKLFPQYIPRNVTTENTVDVTENCTSGAAANISDTDSNDIHDEKKYLANGEMHDILPVPRRPRLPRPNCRRRTRAARVEPNCDIAEGNFDNDCERKPVFGLGFSSSLARQAVMAAQEKSGMVGWRMVEEATFGESDSDS